MRRGLSTGSGIVTALSIILTTLPGAGAQAQSAGPNYYGKRSWGSFSGGQVHISSFVFRDVNNNGKYDLEDRPFANIAVELDGANGKKTTRRTNISGFSNFRASAVKRDREIVDPGAYTFRVVPPPGWTVTTGNQTQAVRITLLPGSPGDLVTSQPARPVGLAPPLEIRGRVNTTSGTGSRAAWARRSDDPAVPIPLSADGSFALAVSPGSWVMEIAEDNDQQIQKRSVEIGRYPVAISEQGSDATANASPTLARFDDLISSESVAKIPGGYIALNWHNWVVTHNRTYGGEGYVNGTISGEYVAYNGSGLPASIEGEQPFDFVGGYFSVAWADAEGETLHIKAWRDGQLQHSDSLELSAVGPVYFAADYRDITRIEFSTEHYWQVVADDLVFRR